MPAVTKRQSACGDATVNQVAGASIEIWRNVQILCAIVGASERLRLAMLLGSVTCDLLKYDLGLTNALSSAIHKS